MLPMVFGYRLWHTIPHSLVLLLLPICPGIIRWKWWPTLLMTIPNDLPSCRWFTPIPTTVTLWWYRFCVDELPDVLFGDWPDSGLLDICCWRYIAICDDSVGDCCCCSLLIRFDPTPHCCSDLSSGITLHTLPILQYDCCWWCLPLFTICTCWRLAVLHSGMMLSSFGTFTYRCYLLFCSTFDLPVPVIRWLFGVVDVTFTHGCCWRFHVTITLLIGGGTFVVGGTPTLHRAFTHHTPTAHTLRYGHGMPVVDSTFIAVMRLPWFTSLLWPWLRFVTLLTNWYWWRHLFIGGTSRPVVHYWQLIRKLYTITSVAIRATWWWFDYDGIQYDYSQYEPQNADWCWWWYIPPPPWARRIWLLFHYGLTTLVAYSLTLRSLRFTDDIVIQCIRYWWLMRYVTIVDIVVTVVFDGGYDDPTTRTMTFDDLSGITINSSDDVIPTLVLR